jgi:hypothetical protein
MWWRVARRAPLQSDKAGGIPTRYKVWRDRVADGKAIDRPDRAEFTFGWMDSVQNGIIPLRNRFQSTFRDDDDDFVGEGNPDNEMLWDDIFYPGTRIEYFVTSNYWVTPNELYYYPDTTGGNFLEFEILPGLRLANAHGCGGVGHDVCVYQPATLYIDAAGGAQFFIENALRHVLNGYPSCEEEGGCPIPPDRNWDRYDYENATSNYNVAFARSPIAGSNNGLTLNQLLGYRSILVNTGSYGEGTMENVDFTLFDSWLRTSLCSANSNRQVFMMNGDQSATAAGYWPDGATFLSGTLGATLLCDAFNGYSQDPDCLPVNDSYCVRLLPAGDIIPFGIGNVDVYGNNQCERKAYSVLSLAGNGMPNLVYSAEDPPKEGDFAEIVSQNLGGGANYRTVIDGFSWHHMTMRNSGGIGQGLCPRSSPSIFEAIGSEIGPALRWGFDPGPVPLLTSATDVGSCQGTWSFPGDVEANGASGPNINRLYPNAPNPFNPRTMIKYTLASAGPVRVDVYDVDGRRVRTLVEAARMAAGGHDVVWDGTNDHGARVGSGVYWAQMRTRSFTSNRKMIVLK